nr:protein indeterminate-domain 2-like [Ipomoea batatas]
MVELLFSCTATPVDADNSSAVNDSIGADKANVSSSSNQVAPPKATSKTKRNLPRMSDLFVKYATRGFKDIKICSFTKGVCHNLSWKQRQRSSKEMKKKVYVCPKPTCVHHDPSQALDDLTEINKHCCQVGVDNLVFVFYEVEWV